LKKVLQCSLRFDFRAAKVRKKELELDDGQ
jgi:hypothetical protein